MAGSPRQSRLVPLGMALMIMGVAFPSALNFLSDQMEPGTPREIVRYAMGILYGGFLVGIVLGAVGIMRNRRAMRS